MLKQILNDIKVQYKFNEENNNHAENCCLLADNFGTEAEKFLCNANLNFRKRFGYAEQQLRSRAHEETRRYISKIK